MTTINRSIIYAKMNVCYSAKSARGVLWINDRYNFDKATTNLGNGLVYPSGKYYNFLIQAGEAKEFDSRAIGFFDLNVNGGNVILNIMDGNQSQKEGYPGPDIGFDGWD